MAEKKMLSDNVKRVLLLGIDDLFALGISCALSDFFYEYSATMTQFERQSSRENISDADIIVVDMLAGENAICFPELKNRKQGIIIGLVDHHGAIPEGLPACFQDMKFISRKATLALFKESVKNAWEEHLRDHAVRPHNNCGVCRRRRLSRQQHRLLKGILAGYSVPEMARQLNVTDKTIFSHKYLLMNKFQLSSDYQLVRLVNKVISRYGGLSHISA